MMGVEQDQGRLVNDRLAPLVHVADEVAGQPHAQALDVSLVPVLVGHLLAARAEERKILDVGAAEGPALEELPPLEDRMLAPDPRNLPGEIEESLLPVVQVPVQPGQLVVLAKGIVVPLLGVPDLVAGQEHGDALGEHQRDHEIALLALAKFENDRVVGRSLGSAVPAIVAARAVAVLLAVGIIMLVIVGDKVLERETVVAGDEVDAGGRGAPGLLVEIAGAGQPSGELRDRTTVTLPEPPDVVAVLAVPLGPEHREGAHL